MVFIVGSWFSSLITRGLKIIPCLGSVLVAIAPLPHPPRSRAAWREGSNLYVLVLATLAENAKYALKPLAGVLLGPRHPRLLPALLDLFAYLRYAVMALKLLGRIARTVHPLVVRSPPLHCSRPMMII